MTSYAKPHPDQSVTDKIIQARSLRNGRDIASRIIAEAIRTLPFDSSRTDTLTEHEAKWRVIEHFAKVMGKTGPKAKNRWRQGVGVEMTTPTTDRANLRKRYGHEPKF